MDKGVSYVFVCLCLHVQDSKVVKVTTTTGQSYTASFAVLALPPPLMGKLLPLSQNI